MIMAHRVVASLPTVSPASIVMPKVLLMYAEASTRATNSVNTQAIQAIQEIQKRAGYADSQLTTTTDPTAFTTAVSNEARDGNSLPK